MKTDTLVRNEGMEILAKNLGLVEAERFIMLIQKEPFDYTKWQEHLFENMTVEEISRNAAEYRQNNRPES
jgi:phospholipid N-methyltransferase